MFPGRIVNLGGWHTYCGRMLQHGGIGSNILELSPSQADQIREYWALLCLFSRDGFLFVMALTVQCGGGGFGLG